MVAAQCSLFVRATVNEKSNYIRKCNHISGILHWTNQCVVMEAAFSKLFFFFLFLLLLFPFICMNEIAEAIVVGNTCLYAHLTTWTTMAPNCYYTCSHSFTIHRPMRNNFHNFFFPPVMTEIHSLRSPDEWPNNHACSCSLLQYNRN